MSADPEKAMEVVDDNDHESLDEDDDEEGGDKMEVVGKKAGAGALTAEMLKNPALMQALQGKLDGIIGTPSGYIESLPAPVKRRLKALKKIQLEATKIEAKFYEEIHALECKYHELYNPLYAKRTKITKGDYEPNDEECEWPSDSEDEDDDDEDGEENDKDAKEKKKKEKEEAEKKKEESASEEDLKGVPEFWLTIFKNVELLQEMVQEHDEAVLKSLYDITVTFNKDPMAFTLHFHFHANDFFANTVLTKEYHMKCEPSEDDPFSFEGPEIYKCTGCAVNWKQGKNLTVKTVKKKQKHKSKGNVRTVTKTVKNDSFFNFFEPPAVPDMSNEDDEIDPETQDLLTSDFEIGHYIRERIIPRAVLFFTGEALEEDDDYDDEDEEGEEEEDEDEDADPDFDPSKVKPGQNPQECKQQ